MDLKQRKKNWQVLGLTAVAECYFPRWPQQQLCCSMNMLFQNLRTLPARGDTVRCLCASLVTTSAVSQSNNAELSEATISCRSKATCRHCGQQSQLVQVLTAQAPDMVVNKPSNYQMLIQIIPAPSS